MVTDKSRPGMARCCSACGQHCSRQHDSLTLVVKDHVLCARKPGGCGARGTALPPLEQINIRKDVFQVKYRFFGDSQLPLRTLDQQHVTKYLLTCTSCRKMLVRDPDIENIEPEFSCKLSLTLTNELSRRLRKTKAS